LLAFCPTSVFIVRNGWHLIVYPRMLDDIGRRWRARAADRTMAGAGAGVT